MALKRRATFWVFAAAMIGSGLGCELIATVDRSKIPDGLTSGSGGAAGSGGAMSSSSSGMAGAGGVGGMGGMGGMGGAGGGATCMTENDCPDPGTVCVVRTCINNQCGTNFAAQGTPLPNQSPNDCTLIVCDGAGSSETVADDLDLPVDGNVCTDDVCSMGVGSNPFLPSGTACGANLICDGNGACVGCVAPSDCPGQDTDCQTRTCNAGMCGFNFAAAGTATTAQTAGDCQVVQCNGSGGTQSAADNADIPVDAKQCTQDVCNAGVPSNPNSPINTACNESNGTLCNGGGACVECNVASTCPGQDTECQARTCNAGVCGVSNTPAGTPVTSQTTGDCKVNQCDGAGGVETVNQNGDLPNDGKVCTDDLCTSGSPSNPPLMQGTVCGMNLICDGNGVCTGCVTAADCPGQDTECQARTCNAGTCGVSNTAAGTLVASQTTGDCKVNQCDGNGAIESVAQNGDLPVDGQECTTDVCTAGTPSNPPVAQGTACAQNGGAFCNGAGACVECLAPTDCPGVDDECQARTCNAGTCGISFTAAGTPVAAQTSGDCQVNQCNGAGSIVSAPSNGDVPVDGNGCTDDLCTAGVPSNPDSSAGAACNENGGIVCSGAGACVACVVGSDCSGQDTECQARTCVAFTCGLNFTAAGTPVASQTSGDCQVNTCNGAGAIVSSEDNSDVPVDANVCTDNVCTAGVPSNPNTMVGTVCGPGLSCDGNGACVGCVTGADCPGVDNACQVRTCTAGSCGISYMPAGTTIAAQTSGDCHVNQCDGAGTILNNIDNSDIPADVNDCTDDLCTAGVPSNPFSPLGAICNQSGGIVCTATGSCVQCNNDFDCTGGAYCSSNMCVLPTCSDALKNGLETDVDCGGGTCAPCNPNQACVVNADCETNVCTGLTCQSPSVLSTAPADGALNVTTASSIAITFTSNMNAGTLSAQTSPGACTGTIQVSPDNFATCIGFTTATPAMSVGNTVATLIPSDALWFASTYKIRVTAAAQDSFGNVLGAAYTHATGFGTIASCTGQKTVVISEVYGAGGNAGAVLKNDYIELHNRGNTPVNLAGWSLQYTSATGTTWTNKTDLSGTIQPGGYWLVWEAAGAAMVPLPPAADTTGTIAMAAGAGKVALVNSTTFLTGACPLADPSVVDFVGYGATANCFEGTGPTAAPSTTLSVQRADIGCLDANNNASDFAALAPAPQNNASPPNICACSLSSLNETNAPNEADYCNIQFPPSFAVNASQPTPVVYGRIYELGVTDDGGGQSPAVSAQVGWGPAASDPRSGVGWYFVPASFNQQFGNDDEYQASFFAPAVPGTYAYVVRFNLNGGGFTYCDLDGAGSNAGLDFSPAQLGVMTVNP